MSLLTKTQQFMCRSAAMEWFGHAASGGHPQSAYNLAVASVNGDHAGLQVTQKPDQRL